MKLRLSRLIAIGSLVASSLVLGAGTASACEGICTPDVSTRCADVSSGGVDVGPGGVTVYQVGVTLYSLGDCI